jgi:hypothetical protein
MDGINEPIIRGSKTGALARPEFLPMDFSKFPRVTEYIFLDERGYLYYCKHGEEESAQATETGTYLVKGSHDYQVNERVEIVHKYFENGEARTLHRVLILMAKMSFHVRRISAFSRHIDGIKKSNGWDFMLDIYRDSEIGRMTWLP